jgi:predicted nucleic acid-binding protein
LAQTDACLLLMDDRLGRREAERAGIPVVGVAAIIGQAQQRAPIPSARAMFRALLASDFRLGRELVEAPLERVEGQGGRGEGN